MPAVIDRLIADGRELGSRMGEHRTSLAAGGLAYFVMLALVPAAIVIGSVVGWFITPQRLQQVLDSLQQHSVLDFASGLESALGSIVEHSSAAAFTITGVIGVWIAVYAASKIIYGTRMALDAAFGVTNARRSMMQRVFATIATLIVLLILAGLLLALAVVPTLLRDLGLVDLVSLSGVTAVDWFLMLAISWLMVRLSYRYLNGAKPRLRWYAPGAIGAALAIMLSSLGVGLYTQLSSTMGAALAVFGSPIVVLLWLYFCFMALLIGAEVEGMRMERGLDVRVRTRMRTEND